MTATLLRCGGPQQERDNKKGTGINLKSSSLTIVTEFVSEESVAMTATLLRCGERAPFNARLNNSNAERWIPKR